VVTNNGADDDDDDDDDNDDNDYALTLVAPIIWTTLTL
jgi:hypothetical protein